MTKPCTQCGRCCKNADFMERIAIGAADIERWKRDGREDIIAQLGELSGWALPGPCPFLADAGPDRFGCSIYETRPETCREYPLAVDHMRFVDCDMLEPGDTDEHVARFMGRSEGARTQQGDASTGAVEA